MKIARVTGILFILATAASILSTPFLAPIGASNYLVEIAANGNQVAVGIFLTFVAAAASASIAISMYPVTGRLNKALALGAVGFRLIEAVFYIVGILALLSLVTLSQEFVNSGSSGSTYYQLLGTLQLAGYRWAGNVASLLAFSIGAFLYYYLFYQGRLVPRWLSGWGLVATAMTLIAGLLVMFSAIGPLSVPQVVLALPIAIQEMVLAVWLLVKGFSQTAIASSVH